MPVCFVLAASSVLFPLVVALKPFSANGIVRLGEKVPCSDLPYSHVPCHKESIFPADKTDEDDERLFSSRHSSMQMARCKIIKSCPSAPSKEVGVARAPSLAQ